MFGKFRKRLAVARLLEEQLFEQVLHELSRGQKRSGLWAKALANCEGSEEKAESLYIRYRVQSIRDESEIIEAVKNDAVREQKLGKRENNEKSSSGESSQYPKGWWSNGKGP